MILITWNDMDNKHCCICYVQCDSIFPEEWKRSFMLPISITPELFSANVISQVVIKLPQFPQTQALD